MTTFRSAPGHKLDFAASMRAAPTEGERLLWLAFQRRDQRPFRVNRQQVLLGYIADFYIPKWRAIVEVDGSVHETDQQMAWDDRRDAAFSEAHYSIFRVDDSAVRRDADLVAELVEEFVNGIEYKRRPGCRYGYSSRASIRWAVDRHTVLHRDVCLCGDARWPVHQRWHEHFFRLTAETPEEVPVKYGSPIGDIECHDYGECIKDWCRR